MHLLREARCPRCAALRGARQPKRSCVTQLHFGMAVTTELPIAATPDLQPLAGEDAPAAVQRVVGGLGGIAQTRRPNGRPGSVIVTDPALIRQVLLRGSSDEEVGLIRNFALRTAAPHGLISLSGAEHRKVRVAAAPCFRGSGLEPLELALDRRVAPSVAAWPTGSSVKVSKLTLDVLCRVFLEWVMGPLDPAREQELVEAELALLEVFHHAVPDLNQLWPTPDAQGPIDRILEHRVGTHTYTHICTEIAPTFVR